MVNCRLCPRNCGVNRAKTVGFCKAGENVVAAKAYLHRWEEPCISGIDENRGSGAVFFSGCQQKCIFCQNAKISHNIFGKELTPLELANVFLNLQESGAYNINLVSPTPYIPQIITALEICKDKLNIPVIMNSGGYEKPETIAMLKGYVNIFLPDFKFSSTSLSAKYIHASDYAKWALSSLEEMIKIAGKPTSNKNGIMTSGVIVRHLVMPGCYRDSIDILNLLYERFGNDSFLLSLMSQYTPYGELENNAEIDRKITTFEYKKVMNSAIELGFDGYFQQKESASEKYIPSWDLSGL